MWTANRIFLVSVSILSILVIFTRLNRVSLGLIAVTALIGFSITHDVLFSVAVACLMGNIYVAVFYQYEMPHVETFADVNGKKTSGKRTKNNSKRSKVTETTYDADAEDEDTDVPDENTEGEEYFVDQKASFLDTVKSLSPKQLKGLNQDTKNLIDTQKQLIETLNQMGPALKDGKNILDTFKNYFGNETDLKKMMPM